MKRTNGTTLATRAAIRPEWGGVWREKILGISAEEVRFARRGFRDEVPGVRERLERAGGGFVDGYNRALRHRNDSHALDATLGEIDRDLQGFAHEGAAMALAIVDLLAPWSRSRWRGLLESHRRHVYLILIGAGWAMARLFRRALPRFARDADPTLWPLIYDGLGFHQAFFRPAKYARGISRQFAVRSRQETSARRFGGDPTPADCQLRPADWSYAANAYDQGLGRALWFVEGASPMHIAAAIESFDPARRGDLWSGAGIACAYAGGLDRDGVSELARRADAHRADFAQGVAFAAKARVDGGNVTSATELACGLLCASDPHTVTRAVEDDLLRAEPRGGEPKYEAWRRLVRIRFSS